MNYNFCPECGTPLTKQNDTVYDCPKGHHFYNNPRAAVAVVFLRDNQALFSKRGIEPNKGRYDFPGGFIDYAEDPYNAVIREVAEETTVKIARSDIKLVQVCWHQYLPGITTIDSIFVVRKWQGEFNPADDSAALEWKSLDFINNDAFVPSYPGLSDQLRQLAATAPDTVQ